MVKHANKPLFHYICCNDYYNTMRGFVPQNQKVTAAFLVRVRPLNNKEQLDINNAELAVAITSSNSLSVTSIDQKKSFQCSYDAVLGPYATQSQVYDKVKECTMAVMNGINATIFAYGQTGSGKVRKTIYFLKLFVQ